VINRRQFVLSGTGALTAACGGKQIAGFNGYAFVANEEGKAIAVVDMAVFSVVRHIPIDGEPTAVISHPTRPFVYALTPGTGTVHEISTETMKVSRKVQAVPTAMAMRIDPGNSALWVLSREARKLVRVPVDSFRPDVQIAFPLEPSDFDLSSFTNLCAVSYGDAGSAGLVDLTSRTVSKPVSIGSSVGTVRFRQDGRALLIANTGDRMLSVLETPGGKVIVNLPLAVRPDNFCFNPNGGQLFITGEGMDVVVVVFPYRIPEVKETVLAGRAPGVMCATEQFLFISNPTAGDVSIFDIKTRKVIAVTAVGSEPSFITMTPGDQYALVLNRKSGDMAVIRLGAIKNAWKRSAALFTMIPVGSKPVSAVVRSV
jgi:YVTN family beta-propeller protein